MKYLEMLWTMIGLTLALGVMLGAILAIALGVFQTITRLLSIPQPSLLNIMFSFNGQPRSITKDGREVEWPKELPGVID